MKPLHQIQRIPLQINGLIGALFLPESEQNTNFPFCVVTLGGNVGGLSEFRAQLLASQGFPSLSLAYFGHEGLPSCLQEISLEYFLKAFDWLKSNARLNFRKIVLWGVSRGAELSLLLGSLFPEKIGAIIGSVPSSVVYGALVDPDKAAWIYQKKTVIPSAPFPFTAQHLERYQTLGKVVSLTPFFLEGMQETLRFQSSLIPVENLQCPLLLFSGEDDQMWPSTVFAEQIKQRLLEKKPSLSCSHYSYPGAGHFITPFCQRPRIAQIHSVKDLWFDFGGSPEADLSAGLDVWEKTVQFLKCEWL